jgi:hypothetical protein
VAWKDVFEEIPIHVRNSPLAAAMLASVEGDAPADARDAARLNLAVAPLLEKNLEFLNDCLDDIVAEQQKARARHACMHACSLMGCWGGPSCMHAPCLLSSFRSCAGSCCCDGLPAYTSRDQSNMLCQKEACGSLQLEAIFLPWCLPPPLLAGCASRRCQNGNCMRACAQVSFYHRNVARQQQQLQQWLQKRRQENATRRLAGEEALPEEDPALFKPIPEPSALDGYLINNQVRQIYQVFCARLLVGNYWLPLERVCVLPLGKIACLQPLPSSACLAPLAGGELLPPDEPPGGWHVGEAAHPGGAAEGQDRGLDDPLHSE